MQLSREMIKYLADRIIARLEEKKMIEIDSSREAIIDHVEAGINHHLALEDELDKEVEGILTSHGNIVDREDVDYRKLFILVKEKLAKERNITL